MVLHFIPTATGTRKNAERSNDHQSRATEVVDCDYGRPHQLDDGFCFDELVEQAYESGYDHGYKNGFQQGRLAVVHPRG